MQRIRSSDNDTFNGCLFCIAFYSLIVLYIPTETWLRIVWRGFAGLADNFPSCAPLTVHMDTPKRLRETITYSCDAVRYRLEEMRVSRPARRGWLSPLLRIWNGLGAFGRC